MDILWEVVEHLSDVRWEASSLVPLVGEGLGLLDGWHFTGDEEPEESFGERLAAFDGRWKELLAFRDSLASESDTLVSIKDRGLPDHSLDASHATVSHIDCNISKLMISNQWLLFCKKSAYRIAAMIFSEFFDLSNLAGNLGSNDFLQILKRR